MKKAFIRINVFCYVVIVVFLAVSVVASFRSGYPWSITCYNCVLCRQKCPLGIDPYGFVTAAISNDPGLYIEAKNLRLRLGEALEVDPNIIETAGKSAVTAKGVLDRGLDPNAEVTVSMIKAGDAARYCPLCGNCEKDCPIDLPIMEIIEDLRDDGKFNR